MAPKSPWCSPKPSIRSVSYTHLDVYKRQGIQFDTLFSDNLYLENGRHAIRMANLLRKAFQEKGYTFYIESPTNQIFIILENNQMDMLQKKVAFSFWEKIDANHTVVRFATSWATKEEDVKQLISIL